MKMSTGLRNYLLSGGSMRGALNGGVIRIYSGAAPASANDAIPGGSTLVAEISDDGTGAGLNFAAAAADAKLEKLASQFWIGAALASQTAGWFRFVPIADSGVLSTTALRMQGTVGTAGADLNMSNVVFTIGATQTVDYFSIFQPE